MRNINFESTGEKSSHVKGDGAHSRKKAKKRKRQFNKFKIQDPEISTTSVIKEENSVPDDDIKTEKTKHENSGKPNFSTLWLKYKPRSTTLVKIGEPWYAQLIKETPDSLLIDLTAKKNLKDLAQKILQQDVINYNTVEARSKKDDIDFRKTVYSHGTFRDKIAANVLRCMEAPAHSLHHLNALISMVSPKAKGENKEALDSIIQLLNSTLLPKKRVARKFENHQFSCLLPLLSSNREQAEKQLALWFFEDQLHSAYRRLIVHLTQIASNTVDKVKMMGINFIISLVKSHPEQDVEYALECVINKLGDPSRKVAAHTMRVLGKLMENRPKLKPTIVTLVEVLLYRPNVSAKSQYYSLCYLKDILLTTSESKLAVKMIKLYIGFFKACTKKGEVDTRLMGALLRGINRAFPYSRLQGEALDEQLQILYKLCHIVNFSIATQALQLIYQIVVSKNCIEDRFYQVLYGQIQDPSFGSSSGNTAFLNLVFKAMMRDSSVERRLAFIKRLLQVSQHQSPHLMCGILFLVSELLREKPEMKMGTEALLKSVDCDDPNEDLETFEDVEDEDEDVPDTEDSVDEEHKDSKQDIKPPEIPVEVPSVSSWFHSGNEKLEAVTLKRKYYDPYLRNPQYCGAHFSRLWEMLFLQHHYHPSVVVFASKILDGGTIEYEGDPMQDFTLIRFLDRFVYRNPKKGVNPKENSSAAVLGSRAQYCPKGVRGVAVNTPEFIELNKEEVPEDERFFHSYFTQFKMRSKKAKDDDEESIGDDEFESYLNNLGGVDDDEENDELDFAAGATGTKKVTEEVMESDEDGNASEDEEPMFGDASEDFEDSEFEEEDAEDFDDNEFEDLDGEEDLDFDEENVEFSDEDDLSSAVAKRKAKQSSVKQPQKKKKKIESLDSVFASADEFAHLLEDNADEDNPMPTATSHALANKDRAHAKQLQWEVDRNERIKGTGRYKKQENWKKSQGHKKQFRNAKGKGFFKPKRGRRK